VDEEIFWEVNGPRSKVEVVTADVSNRLIQLLYKLKICTMACFKSGVVNGDVGYVHIMLYMRVCLKKFFLYSSIACIPADLRWIWIT